MAADGASVVQGGSSGTGEIQVQVKLYGGLGKYALGKYAPGERAQFVLTLRSGATLGDVIDRCSLPSDTFVALINGRRAERDTLLDADDILVFFPPISGG
jgi:molybdopterin converting factor small subunit